MYVSIYVMTEHVFICSVCVAFEIWNFEKFSLTNFLPLVTALTVSKCRMKELPWVISAFGIFLLVLESCRCGGWAGWWSADFPGRTAVSLRSTEDVFYSAPTACECTQCMLPTPPCLHIEYSLSIWKHWLFLGDWFFLLLTQFQTFTLYSSKYVWICRFILDLYH